MAVLFAAIGQPVKMHGRLKVEGTRLLDEHHHPYALHGMSFGWSCFWPRFYNAGTVDWLYKDWNCSVLRAAMGVEPNLRTRNAVPIWCEAPSAATTWSIRYLDG